MPSWRRRLLGEPTVHFVLLGIVLFSVHGALVGRRHEVRDDRRIRVSAAFANALQATSDRRAGGPGDDAERAARVQDFIEEEVLYREALALGLDRGDPVVRRRMTQKMEFLLEDPTLAVLPDDADLQGWLETHPDRYRVPARFTLVQVFFSRDRRGDQARVAAEVALSHLQDSGGGSDGLGDAFPLAGPLVDRSPEQLAATFGPGFAAAVTALPIGRWAGPLSSAYGWHLVHVERRSDERLPTLVQVRARVQADLMAARRDHARRAAMQSLLKRYDVVVEDGASGALRRGSAMRRVPQ